MADIDKLILLTEALKKVQEEPLKVVAADLGLSYQVLVNKMNFGNDQFKTSLLIDFLSYKDANPMPFLQAFAGLFDAACYSVKPQSGEMGSLFRQMSIIAEEVGDVANHLNAAAEDGKITRKEKIGLMKEVDEAISALAAFKNKFNNHEL